MGAIRIWKDPQSKAVVFDHTTIQERFTNILQAVVTDAGNVTVFDIYSATLKQELNEFPYTDILRQDGSPAGSDVFEVVNYLNSQFQAAGGGAAPVITSSLTEGVVENTPFNYTITATNDPILFGASGLPAGISVNAATGQIFGYTNAVGVHTVIMSAMNTIGVGTANLTLTVSATGGGFTNTYSVLFKDSVFKNHLSIVADTIQRTSHQAWSLDLWIYINNLKASDIYSWGTGPGDTVYVGLTAAGAIRVLFQKPISKRMEVTAGSLVAGTWYHITVVNTGTGTADGVTVYVDAVAQTKTVIQDDLGATQAGSGSTAYIARASGNLAQSVWLDAYIDSVSYWDKALSAAEVADIYNGGTPRNLTTLPFVANLKAWWRMGDAGDLYPNLSDHVGANHATMINMTGLNIESFTP